MIADGTTQDIRAFFPEISAPVNRRIMIFEKFESCPRRQETGTKCGDERNLRAAGSQLSRQEASRDFNLLVLFRISIEGNDHAATFPSDDVEVVASAFPSSLWYWKFYPLHIIIDPATGVQLPTPGLSSVSAAIVVQTPSIVTSVWLWLYAGSTFILSTARRFDVGFDWFNRRFDIEKKPLQSIGLVAGALVAVVYWAAVVIGHFV